MHGSARRDRGFSLVELLVAIVILGVLSAVVVFAIRGATDNAGATACESDRSILGHAEEVFRAQHGRYATEIELVDGGLLREQSVLNDIDVSDDGYAIVRVAACTSRAVAAPAASTVPDGSTPSSSVSFTATRSIAIAAALPSKIVAGEPIAPGIEVRLVDANGKPELVDGVPVTVELAANAAGARVSGTTTVTTAGGVARFADLAIDRTGSDFVLQVTAPGAVSATSTSFSIDAGAAVAIRLIDQPTAGLTTTMWTTQPTFTVVDRLGNTVPTSDATISLGIEPGTGRIGASLSCADTSVTISSGVAQFADCKIATAGVGYRLTATSPGLASITTEPFSVSGPPTRVLYAQQPTDVVAGDRISPAVTVAIVDSSGNVVTASDASVTIAIAANRGGGTLAGTTTMAVSNGLAVFADLSIDRSASRYTLAATSPGLTRSVSVAFDVAVGPPARLEFTTQPDGVRAGVRWTVQPRVVVRDSLGNTVTGAAAEITLAVTADTGSPDAHLQCNTNPRNTAAGVAVFAGCSIDRPGPGYSLTASSGGLDDAISSPFDNPVGPPTKLVFEQQPSDAAAGASILTRVSVQDSVGNVVTDSDATVAVTLSSGPAGGDLSGAVDVEVIDGVAVFDDLQITTSGTGYRLTASSVGLSSVTSTKFAISPAAAARLEFVTQPPGASANAAWSTKVAVTDTFGNRVTTSPTAVTLSISAGTGTAGASLTCSPNPVTTASGLATFKSCRIDKTGAGYVLRAASPGLVPTTSQTLSVR